MTSCRLLLLRVLLMVLPILPGCAPPSPPEPEYRIGFSQCTMGDAWRRAMLAGMQKELSFHPNVRFQMLDAHNDTDRQRRQVQQLIRQGVDLLIISPNQSGPLTALTEAAYNQGIPVVILDRRTASPLYTAYVGGNNLDVGRTAGHYAAQLLHQQGQVLEITGATGSSPAADRHTGFAQALAAYPQMRLVARLDGHWLPATVLRRLPALLRAHPETDLIFAQNDPMGRAAYQVVRQLGRTRHIRIVGVDGLSGPGNGLQLVQDGALQATLLYPTGGEEAIRTALRILQHEPYEKENLLGTMVIDSTNVGTMRVQTEKLATQQLTLRRQQERFQAQSRRYASQKTTVYLLVASLLLMVLVGGWALRSARANRRIRRQLEGQNEEIRLQRNQLAELGEEARRAPRGQAALLHQLLARAAHPAHPHSGAGGGVAHQSRRPDGRPAPRPATGAPQHPAPVAAGESAARIPQD